MPKPPATCGRQVSHSLSELRSREKKESRPKEPTPVTRFNQEISPHRVWDATQFELDDFKKIKSAVPGATVNDVVLTVCGGAMRRLQGPWLDTLQAPGNMLRTYTNLGLGLGALGMSLKLEGVMPPP